MSKGNDNPYASPMTKPVQNQQSGQGQLASLGDRFLGSLIDGLVLMVPSLVIYFSLIAVLAGMGFEPGTITFILVYSLISFVVFIATFLAINGYLLANKGQTVGKVVMKTQIVSDAGTMVPFGELILKRYLPIWAGSVIPYIGGLVGLVNALLIFRGNRKCLHDEIAGTKVISLK